jgi:hypothetical protein
MPSAAEEALVKIAMNEYAVGDVAGALALADPLIRWDDRALDADGELIWGQEDVLTHIADWMDGWDAYGATVEEIRAEGDRFVAVYTEEGIDGDTGMQVQHRRAAAIKVERGVIVLWARYLSESEAVGAAQAGSGVDRF